MAKWHPFQKPTLNCAAADVMRDYDIHAVTDITGFGLAGHGYEMASGSDVCPKTRDRAF